MRRVHAERPRLLLVEGTQARVVLRSGLAQLQVLAHNAHDVRLLLHELCEVIRHKRCNLRV